MPIRLHFLPGTMCDQRIWEPVYPFLSPDFLNSYIAIERCIHRKDMHATITDAYKAYGPLHIIAFSMGGYLAMEYALAHPGKVRSLVIIGVSAFGLQDDEKRNRMKIMDALTRHAYRGITEHRIRQLLLPSHQQNKKILGILHAMDDELGKEILLAQLKETTERRSLENRLHELNCPILLVGSSSDSIVPPGALERMRQLIPDCRLVMLEETGHMITLEKPKELAEHINHFYSIGY